VQSLWNSWSYTAYLPKAEHSNTILESPSAGFTIC
jgi:hypothetical protein